MQTARTQEHAEHAGSGTKIGRTDPLTENAAHHARTQAPGYPPHLNVGAYAEVRGREARGS